MIRIRSLALWLFVEPVKHNILKATVLWRGSRNAVELHFPFSSVVPSRTAVSHNTVMWRVYEITVFLTLCVLDRGIDGALASQDSDLWRHLEIHRPFEPTHSLDTPPLEVWLPLCVFVRAAPGFFLPRIAGLSEC